ncbi:MAG: hypothetical protein KDA45_16245, partial [Planctomycetales bacterium]|nr:hypothetical protein [Planctomycetales bacterium]
MDRYHTQFAAAGPRRLPRRLGHLERLESRALLAGLTCLGDYVLLQDECAAHRGPFELVGGSSHCPDQAELVPPAVPASRQLGTQPDALPADISPNTEPGTVS